MKSLLPFKDMILFSFPLSLNLGQQGIFEGKCDSSQFYIIFLPKNNLCNFFLVLQLFLIVFNKLKWDLDQYFEQQKTGEFYK